MNFDWLNYPLSDKNDMYLNEEFDLIQNYDHFLQSQLYCLNVIYATVLYDQNIMS